MPWHVQVLVLASLVSPMTFRRVGDLGDGLWGAWARAAGGVGGLHAVVFSLSFSSTSCSLLYTLSCLLCAVTSSFGILTQGGGKVVVVAAVADDGYADENLASSVWLGPSATTNCCHEVLWGSRLSNQSTHVQSFEMEGSSAYM
jgi:hypothetical protein